MISAAMLSASWGANLRIGASSLPSPRGLANGAATVAVRPEDVALVSPDRLDGLQGEHIWRGQIIQLSDLGHYRKAFAQVNGLGRLKLYLPKSALVIDSGDKSRVKRVMVSGLSASEIQAKLFSPR